jgi:hypothetical protein
MGSFKQAAAFDPLDLEIIDRVYEAAWAQVEARDPDRDRVQDPERQEALRKLVFAFADTRRVDFDSLYELVSANMNRAWTTYSAPREASESNQR